jgi:tetratricopeptide (TPR) repeat protein
VLELAPPGWARRPRAVEALSMRFAENKQADALVVLAAREAPKMPPSTARLNVVLNAIDAAEELPADSPEQKEVPALVELGSQIAKNDEPSVLLDDRSSLYLSLIKAEKAANPARAKQLAASLSKELDAQALKETDPARRRVWDPHRVEAYLALQELGEQGQAERAIPMLEQSERDAPQDYNAPARLARVYYSLKRLPEARAAIDRALPLADGPRKLRLSMLKADILVASGDTAGARAALQAASEFAKSAQLPEQYDKLRQQIEQRANGLGVQAAASSK